MAEPQLVTPLEKLETLEPFEGSPVLGVGIELPGAGGGLREALTIDPVVFHKNDVVHMVVKFKVGKVRFDPVKDTDAVRRIHVGEVMDAAIVSAEDVSEMLEAQAQRIEEARGIQRLDFDGDEMKEAHDGGDHAEGLVEGCPDCDLEAELEASEKIEDLERRDELADRRQAKAGGADGGDD